MQNLEINAPFLWEYLREVRKPIILYGTGDGADKILAIMKRYGLRPVCFSMSGDFANKPDFRGYAVLPFEEVQKRYSDFILLICFGSDNADVLERLYALANADGVYAVYAPDAPVAAELHTIADDIYTPDYIEEHADKFAQTRELFKKDAKSLEVFDGWLQYRLSGDLYVLQRIASPRQEVISLLKLDGKSGQEFFVDAGAFKGDTVEEFLAAVGQTNGGKPSPTAQFARIIAIEPDIKNFTLLRRKFYPYGKELFVPVNGAAWSADESLTFSLKSGKAGHVLSGEQLNEYAGRTCSVKGVKIDTLCEVTPELKPTFIKIDVEGAERAVLEGAKNTITKHRPKMLVSLYHRSDDMFELPLLLHSWHSGYKFALRKTHCLPGWEFQLVVYK
ncbi:MAG: FkbM family methyltransferase [Oscillospiraceae bacterium]|nr:FkbM family methyltransferase [Oscillospiraceae bacterium]